MRNITFKTKYLKSILLVSTMLLSVVVSAQLETPFTPRYSEAINGDMTMIANNITSAHATNDFNGNGNNQDAYRVFVDIDSDNTTFNSSSANFINPLPLNPCLTVRKAFLYWSAADMEYTHPNTGTGGTEETWDYRDVKVMLPGASTYTTVTADDVMYRGRDTHYQNDGYACFKDITADVNALADPFGTYQIANIKATEGDLQSHNNNNAGVVGGWQVIFVYESNNLDRRNVTLFDGFAIVHTSGGFNNYDIDFNGFQTVPAGAVNANILFGSIDGDKEIMNDQLRVQDTNGIFQSLSTPVRTANNFFRSSITVGGAEFIDRSPASTNTLGYDAGLFPLDNVGNTLIGNNQTDAKIRLASNGDLYSLYLLGISVEVFEPSLGSLLLTTEVVGATFHPGETATARLLVQNVGNDDIRNLEISATLPPQMELTGTSPLAPGIAYTFDPLTREVRFTIPDGYTDVGNAAYFVDMFLYINDTCGSCSTTVSIQAVATFTGVSNPAPRNTLSSGTVNACGVGNHDPTVVFVIPTISIVDSAITEGGNLFFALNSSHMFDADVIFNLSYRNINASDSDYLAQPTFTINAGIGSTVIFIPTVDDALIEPTETFEITISTVSNVTLVDDTATGTITDNDLVTGNGIAFTNTDIIVTEGTDAFAVFNVALTANISENVTVDFTTSEGTALNTADFSATAGTLTFTPTIGSLAIQVPITNDMVIEPTEGFTVTLSNIQSNLGIGFTDGNTTNLANATINDDDMVQIIVEPYDETLTITCGNEIPAVPTLVFTGGCGNYSVKFTEVEDFSMGTDNFQIIRTWNVTDSCGNTASFQQIIFVQQRERAIIEIDICVEDDAIDLINALPSGFDTTGTFTVTKGNVILNGSLFEPNGLELGDYSITYESTTGSCNYFADFVITVNADCSPCNINNIVISKTITVNGDGINDFFEISGLESCGYTYHVKIFNRWGTKIYESQEYRNNWGANAPGDSFGTHTLVPTGTYYYIITLSDAEKEPVNGYIYIGSN